MRIPVPPTPEADPPGGPAPDGHRGDRGDRRRAKRATHEFGACALAGGRPDEGMDAPGVYEPGARAPASPAGASRHDVAISRRGPSAGVVAERVSRRPELGPR